MKSASLLLTLALLLLGIPTAASSASTGQGHKPATSILAVKSLYHPPRGDAATDGTKDDFARLNKLKKDGGRLTRDSVHDAVVTTKRQRASLDIVVMGVASWN